MIDEGGCIVAATICFYGETVDYKFDIVEIVQGTLDIDDVPKISKCLDNEGYLEWKKDVVHELFFRKEGATSDFEMVSYANLKDVFKKMGKRSMSTERFKVTRELLGISDIDMSCILGIVNSKLEKATTKYGYGYSNAVELFGALSLEFGELKSDLLQRKGPTDELFDVFTVCLRGLTWLMNKRFSTGNNDMKMDEKK